MQPKDFARLANNFYNSKNLESHLERINVDGELINYFNQHTKDMDKKYKVAFAFICLNPLYWEFAPEMVQGAKNFLLPGHQTDFFFWTDIPEKDEDIKEKLYAEFKRVGVNTDDRNMIHQDIIVNNKQMNITRIANNVINLRKTEGVNIIPTEPIEWPMPTLLRYNLMLQQEEKLKEYDYIFYCDIDMQFVSIVGDEILGSGLTATQQPMYALRKEWWPPYEPNEFSASYIKRPGKVILENGKNRFMPLYFAGGFQGGKSAPFIQAMKEMKAMVDKDLAMNYIPIWNDETVWNKYLFDNPPEITLSPSYTYPDSLIEEYFKPMWGCDYQPKLKTLTKWFSLSKQGGTQINDMLKDIRYLQK